MRTTTKAKDQVGNSVFGSISVQTLPGTQVVVAFRYR